MKRNSRSTCIYITSDDAIIHALDLGNAPGSGKQMLMDMMLRGVLADVRRLASPVRLRFSSSRGYDERASDWLSFAMVYTASGPVRAERYPLLAIGKREPRLQPGLLIPNPFFISPEWWENVTGAALDRSRLRPWRERSSKVLFRGACGPGAAARWALVKLADPSRRLDVGFTSVDGYKSIAKCVDDLARKHGGDASDREFALRHRVVGHMPQTNYSRYKYLLHMPGSATGSYSRNLQYLFVHGSIVLIWKHEAKEWYYDFLRDGVHYVSVNASNLFDKLREVDADAELQYTLRKGAHRFFVQHLARRPLVDRWRAIFEKIGTRQRFKKPPRIDNASACTCDAGLLEQRRHSECLKCEITHKDPLEIARFIGLSARAEP